MNKCVGRAYRHDYLEHTFLQFSAVRYYWSSIFDLISCCAYLRTICSRSLSACIFCSVASSCSSIHQASHLNSYTLRTYQLLSYLFFASSIFCCLQTNNCFCRPLADQKIYLNCIVTVYLTNFICDYLDIEDFLSVAFSFRWKRLSWIFHASCDCCVFIKWYRGQPY